MPKLTRLRLACVGHANARFEDVILNFQDAASSPTDSTLWLRNAGGKSSLLNLFFATVRPDKRDFLGAKADAKRRKIEDYIQDKDRSVVVCEWEMDAERDSLELPGARERLLTGVFYEKRADGGELRRLFFSCKVAPQHPELTLEGLPILRHEGARKTRRSFPAFRQEWQNLRDAHPHLNISATENHTEWAETLEQARIDPELFGYQVRMNHREGGADDLFKFDEAEDFIKFLLDMVLDPSLADGVRANIETFRRELKERIETLLPMRDLLTGVLSRLEPLAKVRNERDELVDGLSSTAGRLTALDERLRAGIETGESESRTRGAEAAAAREQSETAQLRARSLQKRVAWIERHLAQKLIDSAKTQDEEARARHFEAQRSLKIWKAAGNLREALRFELQAAEYRKDLERRHKEQAPLIQELAGAASTFASALLAHQSSLKKEEEAARQAEAGLRAEVERLRVESAAAQSQAAAAIEEARGFEKWIKESREELDLLGKNGVLLDDEPTARAEARLASAIEDAKQATEQALAGQAQLRGERSLQEAERERAARQAAQAAERSNRAFELLRSGEERRRKLETDAVLLSLLQLESLDLDAAAESVPEALRRRLRDAAESLISLRIQHSADERALYSLEQTGLLPPTRDAEKVLKAVKAKAATAWSGWTYLSQNVPDAPGARRKAVQKQPLLALGVVVRDEEFDKACAAARDAQLDLETPLVLFKQSGTGGPGAGDNLVLGPGSDAYFDFAAGKEALIRKRREAETATARIDEITQERGQVESLLRSLESFFAAHPKGWFRQQEAVVQAEESALATAEKAVKDAFETISRIDLELTSLAEEARAAAARKELSVRHAGLLERYIRSFGSKLPDWERGLSEAREKRARAEKRSLERLTAMRSAETAAGEQVLVWSARDRDHRQAEQRLQAVMPHLQGSSPKPKRGQLDHLEAKFEHLLSVFEKTVDEAGLKQSAKNEDAHAKRSRKMFVDALSGGIVEKDVQKALDGLDDHAAVEGRADDAQQQLMAMTGALGNLKKALEAYESRRAAADTACTELGVTERDRPKDEMILARAEQEVADKKVEIDAETRRASELELKGREHEQAALDASHRADLARGLVENLDGIKSRFAGLLEQAARPAAADAAVGLDHKGELREIERQLAAAHKSSERLDGERREKIAVLRKFVTEARFLNLKSEFVQRFSAIDEIALEVGIAGHREDIALHLKVTEQHIADKEKHRELLVQQMLGVAEEGLSLLKRAQKQSLLPATLPGLGGSQFLHINLTIPDDSADKRARLGELVDEWVNTGNVPSAITLIQQAVLRLSRPVRVKVLNPDPDLKAQAVDISEMTRFSGGERLTCAILLYCTLAQLRARTRGLSRSPSSVLLLDNPIGRASRPKFLELQRAVAREMGVQLIYTTGVDDYGALHALPNTVRLRNSRISRATGQHVVELEPPDESVIETAQLSRKEDPASPHN